MSPIIIQSIIDQYPTQYQRARALIEKHEFSHRQVAIALHISRDSVRKLIDRETVASYWNPGKKTVRCKDCGGKIFDDGKGCMKCRMERMRMKAI